MQRSSAGWCHIRSCLLLAGALCVLAGGVAAQVGARGVTEARDPEHPGLRRAVVIGVSEYQNIGHLRYAAADAKAVAEFLRSPAGGGLDSTRLIVLTDGAATGIRIDDAIEWLINSSRDSGEAVIYFAGHGDVEVVAGDQEELLQQAYLLAADAPASRSHYGMGGAYWVKRLSDRVDVLVRRHVRVILFTDACRSGTLAGTAEGAQSTAKQLADGWSGSIKLVSSGPKQLSYEGAQWGGGHGAFTFYLLQGLRGLAAPNGADHVEIGSLDRFVEDNVRRETGDSQVPVLTGDPRISIASVDSLLRRQLLAHRESIGVGVGTVVASRTPVAVAAPVDSGADRELKAFGAAVERRQLVAPAGQSAWDAFQRLRTIPAAVAVLPAVQRTLSTALQEDAQRTIAAYLAGGNVQPPAERFRESAEELRRAATLLSNDSLQANAFTARQYFLDGYALVREGGYDAGIKLLLHSIELEPRAAYAYNALGLAYVGLHRYSEAERAFSNGRDRALRWAYPMVELGKLYSSLGRSAEAAQRYQAAVESDPNLKLAQSGLGENLIRLGREQEGLKSLQRALEIQRELADTDRAWLASTLFTIGTVRSDMGQQDSALAYFRRALPMYRAVHDAAGEATVLNGIGAQYRKAYQQDSAFRYYRQALTIRRTIHDVFGEARTLENIGAVYGDMGQIDSALVYYRRALPIERAAADSAGVAVTLNNLGVIFGNSGQPDSARACFHEALQIRRARHDSAGEAVTTTSLGAVFAGQGNNDSALAYFHRALPLHHAANDSAGEARALSSIGLYLRDLRKFDSALVYYRRAIVLAHADRALEARTLSDIGVVYRQRGQPDSALVFYRQALPMHRIANDPAGEAATLANVGTAYGAKAQRADVAHRRALADSALAYLDRALPVQQSVHDRFGEAATLNVMGVVYQAVGEVDSAQVFMQRAADIRHAIGDRVGEARTLYSLALITNHPDSAVIYFDRSTTISSAISRTEGSETAQLAFNEATANRYASWTLAWLDTSRHASAGAESKQTADAAFAALATSERARAQVLLRRMTSPRDLQPGADLSVEGRNLVKQALTSAAGGLIYGFAGNNLITWLVLPDGRVFVSTQDVPRAHIDTLASALQYLMGTPDSIQSAGSATGPFRGIDVVNSTRLAPDLLGKERADSGRAVRRQLATVLLPPEIRSHLPPSGEVMIVPQGSLALIPFGVLPVGGDTLTLGDQFALRYGPSLATLAAAEARRALPVTRMGSQMLSPALIVGGPTMPSPFTLGGRSYPFGRLPAARDEGQAVAREVGVTEWLTGDRATETAVRAAIPKARLIHLATNGMAFGSEAESRQSFVALAPDVASGYDGRLSAQKILDSIAFHADLVVLSAGRSEVGEVKLAEGTIGLPWAVLAKGARSVIASLWNVDDDATRFLMERFYSHWLHDAGAPSKSEALRRAQLDVRTESRNLQHPEHRAWADPFYWAGFQVIGAR